LVNHGGALTVDQRLHVFVPKARAVFAHVPAIAIEASALERDAHLGVGEPAAVLDREDDPKSRR